MAELKLSRLIHGGDYNPDQWRSRPDILEEDIRLMKACGCTVMSVGIFAWSALEPEEGVYDFDWLEQVLGRLDEAGIGVFLATPSGARPAWMSQKYPEVLRTGADGRRILHGGRHNHCYTSPVYRAFVQKINAQLARRFGAHPAVRGWHISNEYGGECHCELCQEAFRAYLKARYSSLDALNSAWWTGFWSKTCTDWSQLHSPSPLGEEALHALNLNWKRFVTHQTGDFLLAEIEPIRALAPELPVTTNFMQYYDGLDYTALSDKVDFVSFDSYPEWGVRPDDQVAFDTAFNFDFMRALHKKPFVLMESTPSQVNWRPVNKLKKPGMHVLSSLQAVAHGSEGAMVFQWRKSRGGSEKFHGAIVGHSGTDDTRTFRDAQQVGRLLEALKDVPGTMPAPPVALIYDVENRWAIQDCQGPRREMRALDVTLQAYAAIRRCGVDVDVIDSTRPLDGYRAVIAPMLYMIRPGVDERLKAFVREGGTVVATAFTGRVDRDDLCFLGGFPGPLRDLFGLWVEETDALLDDEKMPLDCSWAPEGAYGTLICDLLRPEGAQTIATYASDFYKGTPCVTVNRYGSGKAIYVATHLSDLAWDGLLQNVLKLQMLAPIPDVPRGVDVCTRGPILFVLNFSGKTVQVTLPAGRDLVDGELKPERPETLSPLGFAIVKREEGASWNR